MARYRGVCNFKIKTMFSRADFAPPPSIKLILTPLTEVYPKPLKFQSQLLSLKLGFAHRRP